MRGVYIYLRIYIFVFVFPPPSPFFVVGLPPALGPFLPLVDEIHCAKYSPPPYFGTDHPLPLPHIRIKTGGYPFAGNLYCSSTGNSKFYRDIHGVPQPVNFSHWLRSYPHFFFLIHKLGALHRSNFSLSGSWGS